MFDDFDTACKVIVISISAYQLILESTAVFTARLSYIKSVTRLIKLVAPILLIIVAVRNTETAEDLSIGYLTLQTWTAVAIWMRFFLFLRTRNKYDWYIRLIIESFYDMRHFLVIMMLGVLAFASAFLQVDIIMIKQEKVDAPEIPEDANWYDKYVGFYNLALKDSILTALGQFDENILDYRDGDWVIFLVCLIFNVIVLLNVLIAVVSETFAEIKEKWEMTSYREKAVTI